MKLRKTLALLLSCALVLILVACGNSEAGTPNNDGAATTVYTIQYGHNQREDSPQGVGVQAFKDKVEELSGGQIKVDIYPNGQLGALREMIENYSDDAAAHQHDRQLPAGDLHYGSALPL